MEESFRQKIKEYFFFMKKDRNGIVVLMVLIVLAIAGHYIVDNIEIKSRTDFTDRIKVYEAWRKEVKNETKSLSLFHFNPNTISGEQFDSLNLPPFVKSNIIRYRIAGGKFYRASDVKKIYGMNDSIFEVIKPWLLFPDKIQTIENSEGVAHKNVEQGIFDPNTAGTDELTRFGFNEFQASNIEKYRAKGGRFDSPEEVMKIYGVDSDLFLTVREHIQIEETIETKPANDQQVELNSADSLELVNLRGIGPVFAARIIKYRNLLGGFSSVDQLLEVYGFPEETFFQLKEKLLVDTLSLNRIRINFAGYTDLIRHPYLKRDQVEAILNYRDRHGPFSSPQQLLGYGLIDSVCYLRIKPYLNCR